MFRSCKKLLIIFCLLQVVSTISFAQNPDQDQLPSMSSDGGIHSENLEENELVVETSNPIHSETEEQDVMWSAKINKLIRFIREWNESSSEVRRQKFFSNMSIDPALKKPRRFTPDERYTFDQVSKNGRYILSLEDADLVLNTIWKANENLFSEIISIPEFLNLIKNRMLPGGFTSSLSSENTDLKTIEKFICEKGHHYGSNELSMLLGHNFERDVNGKFLIWRRLLKLSERYFDNFETQYVIAKRNQIRIEAMPTPTEKLRLENEETVFDRIMSTKNFVGSWNMLSQKERIHLYLEIPKHLNNSVVSKKTRQIFEEIARDERFIESYEDLAMVQSVLFDINPDLAHKLLTPNDLLTLAREQNVPSNIVEVIKKAGLQSLEKYICFAPLERQEWANGLAAESIDPILNLRKFVQTWNFLDQKNRLFYYIGSNLEMGGNSNGFVDEVKLLHTLTQNEMRIKSFLDLNIILGLIYDVNPELALQLPSVLEIQKIQNNNKIPNKFFSDLNLSNYRDFEKFVCSYPAAADEKNENGIGVRTIQDVMKNVVLQEFRKNKNLSQNQKIELFLKTFKTEIPEPDTPEYKIALKKYGFELRKRVQFFYSTQSSEFFNVAVQKLPWEFGNMYYQEIVAHISATNNDYEILRNIFSEAARNHIDIDTDLKNNQRKTQLWLPTIMANVSLVDILVLNDSYLGKLNGNGAYESTTLEGAYYTLPARIQEFQYLITSSEVYASYAPLEVWYRSFAANNLGISQIVELGNDNERKRKTSTVVQKIEDIDELSRWFNQALKGDIDVEVFRPANINMVRWKMHNAADGWTRVRLRSLESPYVDDGVIGPLTDLQKKHVEIRKAVDARDVTKVNFFLKNADDKDTKFFLHQLEKVLGSYLIKMNTDQNSIEIIRQLGEGLYVYMKDPVLRIGYTRLIGGGETEINRFQIEKELNESSKEPAGDGGYLFTKFPFLNGRKLIGKNSDPALSQIISKFVAQTYHDFKSSVKNFIYGNESNTNMTAVNESGASNANDLLQKSLDDISVGIDLYNESHPGEKIVSQQTYEIYHTGHFMRLENFEKLCQAEGQTIPQFFASRGYISEQTKTMAGSAIPADQKENGIFENDPNNLTDESFGSKIQFFAKIAWEFIQHPIETTQSIRKYLAFTKVVKSTANRPFRNLHKLKGDIEETPDVDLRVGTVKEQFEKALDILDAKFKPKRGAFEQFVVRGDFTNAKYFANFRKSHPNIVTIIKKAKLAYTESHGNKDDVLKILAMNVEIEKDIREKTGVVATEDIVPGQLIDVAAQEPAQEGPVISFIERIIQNFRDEYLYKYRPQQLERIYVKAIANANWKTIDKYWGDSRIDVELIKKILRNNANKYIKKLNPLRDTYHYHADQALAVHQRLTKYPGLDESFIQDLYAQRLVRALDEDPRVNNVETLKRAYEETLKSSSAEMVDWFKKSKIYDSSKMPELFERAVNNLIIEDLKEFRGSDQVSADAKIKAARDIAEKYRDAVERQGERVKTYASAYTELQYQVKELHHNPSVSDFSNAWTIVDNVTDSRTANALKIVFEKNARTRKQTKTFDGETAQDLKELLTHGAHRIKSPVDFIVPPIDTRPVNEQMVKNAILQAGEDGDHEVVEQLQDHRWVDAPTLNKVYKAALENNRANVIASLANDDRIEPVQKYNTVMKFVSDKKFAKKVAVLSNAQEQKNNQSVVSTAPDKTKVFRKINGKLGKQRLPDFMNGESDLPHGSEKSPGFPEEGFNRQSQEGSDQIAFAGGAGGESRDLNNQSKMDATKEINDELFSSLINKDKNKMESLLIKYQFDRETLRLAVQSFYIKYSQLDLHPDNAEMIRLFVENSGLSREEFSKLVYEFQSDQVEHFSKVAFDASRQLLVEPYIKNIEFIINVQESNLEAIRKRATDTEILLETKIAAFHRAINDGYLRSAETLIETYRVDLQPTINEKFESLMRSSTARSIDTSSIALLSDYVDKSIISTLVKEVKFEESGPDVFLKDILSEKLPGENFEFLNRPKNVRISKRTKLPLLQFQSSGDERIDEALYPWNTAIAFNNGGGTNTADEIKELSDLIASESAVGFEKALKGLKFETKTDPEFQKKLLAMVTAKAVYDKRYDFLEIVVNDAAIDPNAGVPLNVAVLFGDQRAVKILMTNEKTDPNIVDEKGHTILDGAFYIHDAALNVLVKIKSKIPEYANSKKITDVLYANRTTQNMVEIAKLILEDKYNRLSPGNKEKSLHENMGGKNEDVISLTKPDTEDGIMQASDGENSMSNQGQRFAADERTSLTFLRVCGKNDRQQLNDLLKKYDFNKTTLEDALAILLLRHNGASKKERLDMLDDFLKSGVLKKEEIGSRSITILEALATPPQYISPNVLSPRVRTIMGPGDFSIGSFATLLPYVGDDSIRQKIEFIMLVHTGADAFEVSKEVNQAYVTVDLKKLALDIAIKDKHVDIVKALRKSLDQSKDVDFARAIRWKYIELSKYYLEFPDQLKNSNLEIMNLLSYTLTEEDLTNLRNRILPQLGRVMTKELASMLDAHIQKQSNNTDSFKYRITQKDREKEFSRIQEVLTLIDVRREELKLESVSDYLTNWKNIGGGQPIEVITWLSDYNMSLYNLMDVKVTALNASELYDQFIHDLVIQSPAIGMDEAIRTKKISKTMVEQKVALLGKIAANLFEKIIQQLNKTEHQLQEDLYRTQKSLVENNANGTSDKRIVQNGGVEDGLLREIPWFGKLYEQAMDWTSEKVKEASKKTNEAIANGWSKASQAATLVWKKAVVQKMESAKNQVIAPSQKAAVMSKQKLVETLWNIANQPSVKAQDAVYSNLQASLEASIDAHGQADPLEMVKNLAAITSRAQRLPAGQMEAQALGEFTQGAWLGQFGMFLASKFISQLIYAGKDARVGYDSTLDMIRNLPQEFVTNAKFTAGMTMGGVIHDVTAPVIAKKYWAKYVASAEAQQALWKASPNLWGALKREAMIPGLLRSQINMLAGNIVGMLLDPKMKHLTAEEFTFELAKSQLTFYLAEQLIKRGLVQGIILDSVELSKSVEKTLTAIRGKGGNLVVQALTFAAIMALQTKLTEMIVNPKTNWTIKNTLRTQLELWKKNPTDVGYQAMLSQLDGYWATMVESRLQVIRQVYQEKQDRLDAQTDGVELVHMKNGSELYPVVKHGTSFGSGNASLKAAYLKELKQAKKELVASMDPEILNALKEYRKAKAEFDQIIETGKGNVASAIEAMQVARASLLSYRGVARNDPNYKIYMESQDRMLTDRMKVLSSDDVVGIQMRFARDTIPNKKLEEIDFDKDYKLADQAIEALLKNTSEEVEDVPTLPKSEVLDGYIASFTQARAQALTKANIQIRPDQQEGNPFSVITLVTTAQETEEKTQAQTIAQIREVQKTMAYMLNCMKLPPSVDTFMNKYVHALENPGLDHYDATRYYQMSRQQNPDGKNISKISEGTWTHIEAWEKQHENDPKNVIGEMQVVQLLTVKDKEGNLTYPTRIGTKYTFPVKNILIHRQALNTLSAYMCPVSQP